VGTITAAITVDIIDTITGTMMIEWRTWKLILKGRLQMPILAVSR